MEIYLFNISEKSLIFGLKNLLAKFVKNLVFDKTFNKLKAECKKLIAFIKTYQTKVKKEAETICTF